MRSPTDCDWKVVSGSAYRDIVDISDFRHAVPFTLPTVVDLRIELEALWA